MSTGEEISLDSAIPVVQCELVTPDSNIGSTSNLNIVPEAYEVPPEAVDYSSTYEFETCNAFLIDNGFPAGLSKSVWDSEKSVGRRFWLVDNSGSMLESDGMRLCRVGDNCFTMLQCTRWRELQECVNFHVEIASYTGCTSNFQLLNTPGGGMQMRNFQVSETYQANTAKEVLLAKNIMESEPHGKTPLTERLQEVLQKLSDLRRKSPQMKKVIIVIATDGLPTDENGIESARATERFVNTVKSLEPFPVSIVFRLCTNNQSVIDFYNELDSQVERPIEVIDDFTSEAEEVYRRNKWLNYALPIQYCREFGFNHSLFDLIDERKLTKDEMIKFCQFLFGSEIMSQFPDPFLDWESFSAQFGRFVASQPKHYNPVQDSICSWIDMKELNRAYGNRRKRNSLSDTFTNLFKSFRKMNSNTY